MGRFSYTLHLAGEDVDVEVEYTPGWFQRGNRSGNPDNWTEDEGESPEINSVTDIDGNDLLNTLGHNEIGGLVARAQSHQVECERDFDEPDYDDDRDGYDFDINDCLV